MILLYNQSHCHNWKKKNIYTGLVTNFNSLEIHECKQSVHTKCLLFDQLITELADIMSNFKWGKANIQNPWSCLLLVNKDELKRWATPKYTGTVVAFVLSSRIVFYCNNSEHSLSKCFVNTVIYWAICFVISVPLEIKWVFKTQSLFPYKRIWV